MRSILVLYISLTVTEGLSFGVPRRLTTRFGMGRKSKIAATGSPSSGSKIPNLDSARAGSNDNGMEQNANNNIYIESASPLGHQDMLDLVYEISLERAGMGSSSITERRTAGDSSEAHQTPIEFKDDFASNCEIKTKKTKSEDEKVTEGIAKTNIQVKKTRSLGHKDMLDIVYDMSLQRAGLQENETAYVLQ
mmetsp:Transcript_16702/g.23557  ORF Transcript_16702/g.23557 Transcript_16702/m.23557 type:complete len:192 (+) Transcript_16702:220-795(+)